MEYFIGPTSGSPSSLHSPNLNIILCLSKTWLVLDILPTEHQTQIYGHWTTRVGNMERPPTCNFTFTARRLLVEVKWKVNRPHQANMELLDVKNRRIWNLSMAWFRYWRMKVIPYILFICSLLEWRACENVILWSVTVVSDVLRNNNLLLIGGQRPHCTAPAR